MKKLLLMCVLGLFCMESFADDLKSVVDSSDNVLTVKVNGTEDIKRIPVEVNMSNPSVPMTCVQCYLQLSDSMAVFLPRQREQFVSVFAYSALERAASRSAGVGHKASSPVSNGYGGVVAQR